jgi:hypothetical protein
MDNFGQLDNDDDAKHGFQVESSDGGSRRQAR